MDPIGRIKSGSVPGRTDLAAETSRRDRDQAGAIVQGKQSAIVIVTVAS